MNWKLSDWKNVPWCEVFIMPFHQGGGDSQRRVTIFYKQANWKNGLFYSGLMSDKFPETIKSLTEKYGHEPQMETKIYVFKVNKDRL